MPSASSGWFAIEFSMYIVQICDGGGYHLGMALADCGIARHRTFLPIIHHFIRQSYRGNPLPPIPLKINPIR